MNWKMVKLGKIAETSSGGTPNRSVQKYWVGGSIPWIKSGQLKDCIIEGAEEYISEEGLKSSSAKFFKKGTLLLALYGATAGKLGFLGIDATTNQAICAIVPKDENLNTKYLYYYLLSKRVEIISDSAGGAQPNISQNYVKEISIPLPPLPIQKRIAEILDAADALKRKDQELLKKYDELAQAIFIDMFGDPVKNEKGWEVKTIRSISVKISDGPFGSNLKTEHYSKEGVRVIRLKNIGVNTFNDEDSAFINIQHYENVLKKHTCIPGDILIGTLGEPNLRACIFPSYLGKAVNKADCVMLRVNSEICNKDFISYFLNIPSFVESVANKLHGQTRTRITMGQVASLLILMPPKSLQDKFSNLIANLRYQNNLTSAQNKLTENLFQTLIQKAFKGELVQ